NYGDCENWEKMCAQLYEELIRLYQEHGYVYHNLTNYDRKRFNDVINKDEYTMKNLLKYTLYDLSRWLNNYHHCRCIVLIDEYDHPLDIAHRHGYYKEACSFFATILGMLLKDNDENLEKALLAGISRVAKSGFLSGLNNVKVFPMHEEKYADKFGFTEDEVSLIIQYHNLETHLKGVKQWYGGYEAGNCIHIYNPWSINSFVIKKVFGPYWINTGGTVIIKKLLWRSSEKVQDQVAELLLKGAIKVNIMDDIDYELLSSQFAYRAFWTLLYYAGYLTMDHNKVLQIPNKEVEMEWQDWLQVKCPYTVNSLLDMLLQGDLKNFKVYLPKIVMEILSCFDVADNQAEFGYHLFMIGLLSQAQFRGYRLMSNKEEGLGRFDLKIEPVGNNVEFETSIIMEFKVLKKEKKKNKGNVYESLQANSKEGSAQILEKKYRSGIPTRSTKLVECGIAFQGKQACVSSRVLHKEGNRWVETAQ
ncbi:4211_t:CDS:2, partial [Entrophospora sp. SA101]